MVTLMISSSKKLERNDVATVTEVIYCLINLTKQALILFTSFVCVWIQTGDNWLLADCVSLSVEGCKEAKNTESYL